MASHLRISPNLVGSFVEKCPFPMVERGDRWICAKENFSIIVYKQTGFIIVTGPDEMKSKIKELIEL